MFSEWMDAVTNWLDGLLFAFSDWLAGFSSAYLLPLGLVLGVALTLLANVVRKAYLRYQLRQMWKKTAMAKKSATGSPEASPTQKRRKGESKTEKFARKETIEERETRLAEMVSEMRELILQLTEIIARTNSASGEASDSFEQAKTVLESMPVDSDIGLREVKSMLLTEIDRMAQTNITLKHQLMKAENGMSRQRKEIDKLKTKAHIDQLTQLLNRAAFDDCLQQAFQNWKRTKEVFSLLMLDVDHFKSINDTHGHVHGDRLLKEIAVKIKEGIRVQDHAARYGGEEFAVILPDTHAEEALMVGTRIRESVERGYFQVETRPLRITISGGISQAGMSWSTIDIIETADKALYQSKKQGRNRITLGGDIMKESWTSNSGK